MKSAAEKKPGNEHVNIRSISHFVDSLSRAFSGKGKELEAVHAADTSRFGQFIEKIRSSPEGKTEKAWFLLFRGSPLRTIQIETTLLNEFVLAAYDRKLKLENAELSARSVLYKFDDPGTDMFAKMGWKGFLDFWYANLPKMSSGEKFDVSKYLEITDEGKLRPTPELAKFMRARMQQHFEVPV